jgi:SecD/SecF fusion protein
VGALVVVNWRKTADRARPGILGILIFVTFALSLCRGGNCRILHDVLMTVGCSRSSAASSHNGRAVLTIAGYPINDTIVVYDRIREGLASGRRGTIEEIMNSSINQTLSRTILPARSRSSRYSVSFLWRRGVARLFLAIIIGVVVGTYLDLYRLAYRVVVDPGAGRGTTSLRREVTESYRSEPACPKVGTSGQI